jgi:hypothetical protein
VIRSGSTDVASIANPDWLSMAFHILEHQWTDSLSLTVLFALVQERLWVKYKDYLN